MHPRDILLADNDRGVSDLLTEMLRRTGSAVVQAFDGEQAKVELERRAFAVLVCDLDMPRVPGLELLEWLAGRARQPEVVVISGYLDRTVGRRLQQLPFVRHTLCKPFDLFGFVRLVASLLEASSGSAAATGGTET